MKQPLALILYEKLLPGSQLVNRLQDLGYRVQILSDAQMLAACAEQEKPLLVLADLKSNGNSVCEAIGRLKRNTATRHVPVIAFGSDDDTAAQRAALEAGATLAVNDAAIVNHLPQLLDQAFQIG